MSTTKQPSRKVYHRDVVLGKSQQIMKTQPQERRHLPVKEGTKDITQSAIYRLPIETDHVHSISYESVSGPVYVQALSTSKGRSGFDKSGPLDGGGRWSVGKRWRDGKPFAIELRLEDHALAIAGHPVGKITVCVRCSRLTKTKK